MNKQNQLRLVATFMMILIVTLPVAFAQQLSITQFSGHDGVDNYARRGDTLTIKVTAAINGNPPEDIAKTRVRLYTSPSRFINFDTCTKQSGNFYDCELSDQETLRNTIGVAGYELRLVDADGSTVESIPQRLTIDSQSPVMKDFDIDPEVTRDSTVTFSYAAEDYAFSTGDTSDCAGIKEVKFIVDGVAIATETGSVNECVKTKAFTHTFAVNGTQAFNVCAQATDYFDRASNLQCENVRIDNSGPEIKSVEIRSPQGFEFTHIKSGTNVRADVAVLIEGDQGDIDPATVTADLSSLNPTLTGARRADRFSQPLNGTVAVFVWTDVIVTRPTDCSVSVSAQDAIGNPAQKTVTCDLPVDDTSPEVIDIRADREEDDKIILPGTGKLYVDIEDLDSDGNPGIGFQQDTVFLDLRELGLSRREAPTSCTQSGSLWTCEFRVAPRVSSGEYTVSINSETRDDLNNLVLSQQTKRVVFDKDPPVIDQVGEVSVIHNGARTTGVAVRGDTIEIRATASDFTNALADFTDLGLGEIQALQCDTQDNTSTLQTCLFSAVIDTSGPYTAEIFITFEDAAGNQANDIVRLEVLGISDEENPNYWQKSAVECSPQLVDRSLTDLINYPVYCQVKLKPLLTGSTELLPGAMVVTIFPGGAAEAAGLQELDVITKYDGAAVADVRDLIQRTTLTRSDQQIDVVIERDGKEETLQMPGGGMGARLRTNRERKGAPSIIAADIADFTTDCNGDLSGYVQEIGVINNQVGTTEPILSIRLASGDFNVKNVTFSCALQIYSQVGDEFTSNPEVEDVDVNIQFYNQPLGTMASNIDDRVDKAVERADDFLSWIDDIQKVLEYAELICTAWNTFVNIISTLGSLLALLGLTGTAVKAIPVYGDSINKAIESASKSICSPTENLRKQASDSDIGKLANKFCGFLSCQYGLLDALDVLGEDTDVEEIGNEGTLGGDYRRGYSGPAANTLFTGGLGGSDAGASPAGSIIPSDSNAADSLQNPAQYMNIKDSLIYSTLVPPLCIPGMIYNLNKLRQIECRYALCMSRDVRNGMPVSTCNDAKHYQICRFVVGEIFNIIPFAPIVSHYLGMLENLLNDPLVLAATLVGWLADCKNECNPPEGETATGIIYNLCAGLFILDLVGRSITTIKQISDSEDLLATQSTRWCDELEEWQDDLQESQQQGQGASSAYGGSQ